MTTPSWRSLRIKKYQFSLRLFLFLNAVSALFYSRFPPLSDQCILHANDRDSGPERITVDMAWEIWTKKELISPLSPYSLGGIWAAHIALKYPALGHYDFSFLLISLLSVSVYRLDSLCREYRRVYALFATASRGLPVAER
ncbi:diguanylate cyclase [Salmonella enterica subsp. enterica]|uniref:Diguanylate cyclase n=1 Tax=Salmonella enterica I TaxID=59201 RepID=A0A447TNJ4_SALET|nr:diguanylate cyclase [Salmonella enterica subsp. enterica]